MKVVVIGGTGLVGSRLVATLQDRDIEALPASPASGVDTLTGEGLAEALTGAAVVVDVSNSPSFDDEAVLHFFETSTRNLLEAEVAAGVGHHVALSVVGTDRLLSSGYFRAKMTQEHLIEASPVPYSIVRATQFFEFLERMADDATVNGEVHLPPAMFQPIAVDGVVEALAEVVVGAPLNNTLEIAGPQPYRLDELVDARLRLLGDDRRVVPDPAATYFGVTLDETALLPGRHAQLGRTDFGTWLAQVSRS